MIQKTVELQNEAVFMDDIDQLALRKTPLTLPANPDGKPEVPEGNVLVRIKVTGICGSDIHLWKHGSALGVKNPPPFVMGHECAGEIVSVGAGVTDWKAGDRIAIKPGFSCNKCLDCTMGRTNLCPTIRYNGTPGTHGGCSTWKVVPEAQLVRLTPKISWTEAGLIQPLAICVQMSRQADLKALQNVMILGGGCIGLLLGAMAKFYGAKSVVILEKQPHRAKFAKEYCADYVFQNPPRSADETNDKYTARVSQQILKDVPELHRGFDLCIEAAGAEECMQLGIKLCRPGGTYVQVGMYRGKHPEINMMEVCIKQLNLRGTIRYTANCFEEAVYLIERGYVDVKSLVSHTFEFKDSFEAFETCYKLEDRQGGKLLKTVILH